MLEDLKLSNRYEGFLFLAEARHNPPWLSPHNHVELELNLVTSGTISYIVNGKRYTFPKGSLLWIFPSQEHHLVDRTPDGAYYVAVFKPGLIDRACLSEMYASLKNDDIEDEGVMSRILDFETFDLMLRNMGFLMEDALDSEILNREAGFGFDSDFKYEHGDPDALNAGLRFLMIMAWKSYLKGQDAANPVELHPSVIKALSYMSNDIDTPKSLEEIAKKSGVSSSYLSRIFHKQIGIPLSRYRNNIRLTRFMKIYCQPEKRTILECVYDAGFGSYAQFYKVFSQVYGISPRNYLMKGRDPKESVLLMEMEELESTSRAPINLYP